MIQDLYGKYLQLTGDAGAAATLVLAEVLSSKEPEWLDVKQSAARLGISRTKMYELLGAGAVRHKRVGRQIRMTPADLDKVATVRDAKVTNSGLKLAELD